MTEEQLHRSVAQYLRLTLPAKSYFTTIGHGGFPLGKAAAGRMKARGVQPGFPDILILYDERAYLIELKTAKGVVSKAQSYCHEAIKYAGCPVAVCRSLDEVIGTLSAWGIK